MPFGLWPRMGSRNHVLDGSRSSHGKGQFWGGGRPTLKGRSAVSCAKTAEPIDMPFGLWTRVDRGPNEACMRWSPDPPCEGAIIRERTCPGIPDDTLPWAVNKWLNRSTNFRLFCGLRWVWRKNKFNRIRQIAPMRPPMRAHWGHLANTIHCSSAVAMRPYVKLLWPLVVIYVNVVYGSWRFDCSSCAKTVTNALFRFVLLRAHAGRDFLPSLLCQHNNWLALPGASAASVDLRLHTMLRHIRRICRNSNTC